MSRQTSGTSVDGGWRSNAFTIAFKNRWGLLIASLGLCLTGASETAHSVGMEIRGNTLDRGYRDDGTLVNVHWGRFVASTCGSRWRIEYFEDGWSNALSAGYLFQHVCNGDGKSVYGSGRPIKRVRQDQISGGKGSNRQHSNEEDVSKLPAMSFSQRSCVPRASGSSQVDISAIWYAYCSADYLNRSTPDALEPPYFVDNDPDFYAKGITNVPVVLHRNNAVPYLPDSIAFEFVWKTMSQTYRLGNLRQIPKALEVFTNALLQVSDFTNVAGFCLPTQSKLSLFCPDSGKTGNWRPRLYQECQVSGITIKPVKGELKVVTRPQSAQNSSSGSPEWVEKAGGWKVLVEALRPPR